jgi:membrane associated rhomboid family serine protease
MTYAPPDDLEYPRLTRAVQWLIGLNVAIYFLQLTVVGSANMASALGFTSQDLSRHWWAVGTYMFVHAGLWPLMLNMYALYLFGPRLEHSWSAGEFTRFYLLCGLGGLFAHLLFVRSGILLGASAAVLGVALAYGVRWPDDEVFLLGVMPLKVKWLVAGLVGVNLVSGVLSRGAGGGVAYLAHVGGLAAGWLYLRSASVTGIDRLRQRVSQVPDVPDEPPRAIPRSLPRGRERVREVDDIVARSQAALARRPASTVPTPAKEADRLTDLNAVLDKISEEGIDSLTADERRLLEEKSRELRRDH